MRPLATVAFQDQQQRLTDTACLRLLHSFSFLLSSILRAFDAHYTPASVTIRSSAGQFDLRRNKKGKKEKKGKKKKKREREKRQKKKIESDTTKEKKELGPDIYGVGYRLLVASGSCFGRVTLLRRGVRS